MPHRHFEISPEKQRCFLFFCGLKDLSDLKGFHFCNAGVKGGVPVKALVRKKRLRDKILLLLLLPAQKVMFFQQPMQLGFANPEAFGHFFLALAAGKDIR